MGATPMMFDLPPRREDYMTDKQYFEALVAYNNQRKDELEMLDWFGAMLIVMAALIVVCSVGAVFVLFYYSLGIKGIAYVAASIGLFWAAVYEVKKRL